MQNLLYKSVGSVKLFKLKMVFHFYEEKQLENFSTNGFVCLCGDVERFIFKKNSIPPFDVGLNSVFFFTCLFR